MSDKTPDEIYRRAEMRAALHIGTKHEQKSYEQGYLRAYQDIMKDSAKGWVIGSMKDNEPFIYGKEVVYDTYEAAEDVLVDCYGHGYQAKGWQIVGVRIVREWK